jgi:hypothetical protein
MPPSATPDHSRLLEETRVRGPDLESPKVGRVDSGVEGKVCAREDHAARAGVDIPLGGLGAIDQVDGGSDASLRVGAEATSRSARDDVSVGESFLDRRRRRGRKDQQG